MIATQRTNKLMKRKSVLLCHNALVYRTITTVYSLFSKKRFKKLQFFSDTNCISWDVDVPGGDLTYFTMPLSDVGTLQCMGECVKHSDCHYWVKKPSDGTCWLKGANPDTPSARIDRNYGASSCSCFEKNKNVTVGSGFLIGTSRTVEDPADCQAACSITKECSAFTIDMATAECYMWKRPFGSNIETQDESGILFGPPVCS